MRVLSQSNRALTVACLASALVVGCGKDHPPVKMTACRLSFTYTESCYAPQAISMAEISAAVPSVDPTMVVRRVTNLPLQSIIVFNGCNTKYVTGCQSGIAFLYGSVPRDEPLAVTKTGRSPFVVVFEDGSHLSSPWRLSAAAGPELWNFRAHGLRVVGNVGREQIRQIGRRMLRRTSTKA